MPDTKASYRQIFKATSLFGGVQVINIIITLIRSKVIAVLLGPIGIGVAGLLTSTIAFITTLTNFGLGVSSVKNVATAYEANDIKRISIVITVLRRLVWITGIVGMIITLLLSKWLSEISFGNSNYTVAFAWLSLSLIFNQLTVGQDVLLQGMRKLRSLALANISGAFLGLIISAPLYYFYGIDGIVPALIGTSILTMLISFWFAKDIKISKVIVSRTESIAEAKDMLRMGFLLSVSSLITVGAAYFIRIYISDLGGIEQVGLFNAGFAIIGTYVGIVFNAMATDFYPRLSGVAHNDARARELINHQAEIAILILAPILSIFLVFINWIVVLLYSKEFLPINEMIHWAALGMYFKAASWSIAFILLAKGESKIFFVNELAWNIYTLILNILGYKFFGLNGLGMSFLLAYILYLLQVYILTKKKYSFFYESGFIKVFSFQLVAGTLAFLITRYVASPWSYIAGSAVVIISCFYSLNELNKRLGLRAVLNKIISGK